MRVAAAQLAPDRGPSSYASRSAYANMESHQRRRSNRNQPKQPQQQQPQQEAAPGDGQEAMDAVRTALEDAADAEAIDVATVPDETSAAALLQDAASGPASPMTSRSPNHRRRDRATLAAEAASVAFEVAAPLPPMPAVSAQPGGRRGSVGEEGRLFRAPQPPSVFDAEEEDRMLNEGGATPSHRPYGIVYSVLRWPLLGLISAIVLLELGCYIAVRWIVHAYELRRYRSRRALQRATTYAEWAAAAAALDKQLQKDAWKAQHESPFYDSALVRAVTRNLRRQMAEGRVGDLQQSLLTACKNNLGGIENELLYSHTYVGTKHTVQDYVDTGKEARTGISVKYHASVLTRCLPC